VTDLTLIFVCASLPGLLLSPFAGVYIDRWKRKGVLVLTDTGAAVGTLSLLALLLADRLELWCIYVVVGFSAAFLSFQIPAFAATVTLMVPKGKLGKANGLLQLAGSPARRRRSAVPCSPERWCRSSACRGSSPATW
jgi:MFS family permease